MLDYQLSIWGKMDLHIPSCMKTCSVWIHWEPVLWVLPSTFPTGCTKNARPRPFLRVCLKWVPLKEEVTSLSAKKWLIPKFSVLLLCSQWCPASPLWALVERVLRQICWYSGCCCAIRSKSFVSGPGVSCPPESMKK